MKKIVLFITLPLLYVCNLHAQVGVNTTNPVGIFHVDPLKNTTNADNKPETSDDIVVDADGNVGIGTAKPEKKLHIEGNAIFTGKDTLNSINVNKIIVNDVLRIGGDSLTDLQSRLEIIAKNPGTGLRIDNGSQKKNSDPTIDMIPVMTKENTSPNQIIWSNLPTITEMRSKKLINNKVVFRSGGYAVNITESPIELDEGYWLILAGTAMAFPRESNLSRNGYYAYLELREVMNDPENYPYDYTILQVGCPSEKGGAGVAVPQLVYLLYVEGTKKYNISASTLLGGTNNASTAYRTVSTYGNSYFYAIKLDYGNP